MPRLEPAVMRGGMMGERKPSLTVMMGVRGPSKRREENGNDHLELAKAVRGAKSDEEYADALKTFVYECMAEADREEE